MPESLGFKYDVFVSQTNQKSSFIPRGRTIPRSGTLF